MEAAQSLRALNCMTAVAAAQGRQARPRASLQAPWIALRASFERGQALYDRGGSQRLARVDATRTAATGGEAEGSSSSDSAGEHSISGACDVGVPGNGWALEGVVGERVRPRAKRGSGGR